MPLGANKVALYGASADTGTAVLLSTATASSSASISFTLPTAYKQVVFSWINIDQTTYDNRNFFMNLSSDGGSTSATKTSSSFFTTNWEANPIHAEVAYVTANDRAQSTSDQMIGSSGHSSDTDQSTSGTLTLYNPAGSTYVKHYVSRANSSIGDGSDDILQTWHIGGYANTTSALNHIVFRYSGVNINSGTIKMWGIK